MNAILSKKNFLVFYILKIYLNSFLFKRTTFELSPSGCKTLQEQIYNITLGRATEQISNYYAPFANSDTKSWQKILNVVPTSYVIDFLLLNFENNKKKVFTVY